MSTILDQFGRTAHYCAPASSGIYATSDDSTYRAARPYLDRDVASLLSRSKHRSLLSDSRFIATAFPLVAGGLKQKSDYVCAAGFGAQFQGEDSAYGATLETTLRAADELCDLRGYPYSFDKCMAIACSALDVDGDFFIHFTERRDIPGFPAFQFIEAHRVGSRYDWGGVIKGGRYDGARVINGIIYDTAGAEIAYNLLGYTPEEDRQIPASDMLHVFDPRWFSEGRGIPTLAYAVLDWYDVKEIREAEKIAQKANAALAIIEKNASGTKPVNNVVGTTQTTTPSGLQTELFENGLVRYVKSGSGEIEAHVSNRPSEGAAKFDRTVVAGAFYGMDWRIEMMDLSQLTGAGVRGFQDNINTAIYTRWGVLARVARICRLLQVAKLTERGDLPAHPEWMKIGHAQPPEFTVDAQRTSQTDRDNVRAGVESMPAVIRRTGRDAEDVLREQARYEKLKARIAQEEQVDPILLGTLSLPGDQATPGAVTTPPPEEAAA